MHRQLPRWAWGGGALLALVAGMINVVGYLGFRHEAVTHLTGTTTLLGIALASADGGEVLHWLSVIVSFVLGSALSGFLIGNEVLRLGRPYGIALAIESALLFAAVPLLHVESAWGLYLASLACGLQNGMASSYSGAVLRTTHVSGSLTDIGVTLGLLLRGAPADKVRLKLCATLTTGFLIGSICGGAVYPFLHERTLLIPAALTGVFGIAYHAYGARKRQ